MLLLVCKTPPGNTAVREWTDMALVAALFQQAPILLLLGPGADNLTGPDSPLAELEGLLTEPVRVDENARPGRHGTAEPVLAHEPVDGEGVRSLFARADQVVTL